MSEKERTETRACDLISRQAAIDALSKAGLINYAATGDGNGMIQAVNVIKGLPPAQEPTLIPDTMAIPSDDGCVSLSETVTATYYDEEYEEWSQKSVTIRDILDSVCDEYTVLPSAQSERLTDDDFETIRIHLNAYKEKLCNLHRWEEAEEYQRVINRFMAFAATQPEESNCEYCREDGEGYVTPLEKNGHAFVRFGVDGWELSLKANGWHGRAKIKFCPMCGRRLTDG